jgi:uncharacterized protein (DUF885 family)
MKKIFLFAACIAAVVACKQKSNSDNTAENKAFAALCEQYYQDGLKLNPISATYIGDERYNDLLANDGSQAYIKEFKGFNQRYLDSLGKYDRENLSANDKLSFDYLKDQLEINIEGTKIPFRISSV